MGTTYIILRCSSDALSVGSINSNRDGVLLSIGQTRTSVSYCVCWIATIICEWVSDDSMFCRWLALSNHMYTIARSLAYDDDDTVP